MNVIKAYKNGLMIIGVLCVYLMTGCKNSPPLFETETVSEVPTFNSESDSTMESMEIEKKGTLVTEVFQENNILIRYPQVTDLKDDNLEEEINHKLKDDALKILEYYKVAFEGDAMESNFDVKKSNEDFLSIVYKGSYIWEGAANHANIIYSSNIDLKTGEHVSLTDQWEVEKIASKLKSKEGYEILTDSEELLLLVEETLDEIDKEELVKMLTEADFKNKDIDFFPEIFSFYTDEGESYITFPLVNSIDDYVVIKIY